jgi:hypothetical protein
MRRARISGGVLADAGTTIRMTPAGKVWACTGADANDSTDANKANTDTTSIRDPWVKYLSL